MTFFVSVCKTLYWSIDNFSCEVTGSFRLQNGGPHIKIQVLGHSFGSHLEDFVLHYEAFPPFSGGHVDTLKRNLVFMQDFKPDVVVLLIGTNDLTSPNKSPHSVCAAFMDLVDTLLFMGQVQLVIVFSILFRKEDRRQCRHMVDISWLNDKVYTSNGVLSSRIQDCAHQRVRYWVPKEFWSNEMLSEVLADDGAHLSVKGQQKLHNSIRAAVVGEQKAGQLVL